IPVDFVVNVILALAAEDESTAAEAGARYFHVVSGTSNPLPFHQMVSTVREYFLDRPIPDPEGEPTPVPEWSFPSSELIEQRIRLKELSSRLGRAVVDRLPSSRRSRGWVSHLSRVDAGLRSLRQFADLYR
ncbi:HAD-IB family hydrolase, partial [Burkholderia multivorans]